MNMTLIRAAMDPKGEDGHDKFIETGLFRYFRPLSLRLKGAPFCYTYGAKKWWKPGIQNRDNSTKYYSTEEVLEMIENPEIKTQLLFHLDLL